MRRASNQTLRRWELALLLGVACAALIGAWLSGQQTALAGNVIRLHVIANSDTEADQALKLAVRDHVLATAWPMLDTGGAAEAGLVLESRISDIEAAAAELVAEWGYDYPVSVSLGESWFPTKEYTDFALPAGNYTALRVVIGSGGGENWWCVVFPPLCLGSVTETVEETALQNGLTEGQAALMTGESGGYVVKFKAIEWWEQVKHWMEG